MKNGGHSGNDECRGYDISVKLVNGEEECTMERKPEIWEHGVETWTGDQLGDCRNFLFDENTIAYILVNSDDEVRTKCVHKLSHLLEYLNYIETRGEASVNTRYFPEHLIFMRKSAQHVL